jgi:hypothetical protein
VGEHLSIIAVMALVPLGAWIAMGEGMVLEKLHTFIVKHVTPFWAKPLCDCARCMTSAWGIPAVLLTFPDLNLWLLPVYILAAVGLQEAIHR